MHHCLRRSLIYIKQQTQCPEPQQARRGFYRREEQSKRFALDLTQGMHCGQFCIQVIDATGREPWARMQTTPAQRMKRCRVIA